MGTFGLVELESAADGVEHFLRDASRDAPLEAGVPLDADPGAERDLLAPQAGHASLAAIPRHAGALRGQLRPTRRQELADHPTPVRCW
jgi:hypothetical protein